MTILDFRWLVW